MGKRKIRLRYWDNKGDKLMAIEMTCPTWEFHDISNNGTSNQGKQNYKCRDCREIIGCHIGDRSRKSAIALWQSIPPVYRQCAKVYTDFWEAYVTVIPSKRHGCGQRQRLDQL